VVTTLSATRVSAALAADNPLKDALVGGFHRGLLVATFFAAVNIALSIASPGLRPPAPHRPPKSTSSAPSHEMPSDQDSINFDFKSVSGASRIFDRCMRRTDPNLNLGILRHE
jgi:hypothetical protein